MSAPPRLAAVVAAILLGGVGGLSLGLWAPRVQQVAAPQRDLANVLRRHGGVIFWRGQYAGAQRLYELANTLSRSGAVATVPEWQVRQEARNALTLDFAEEALGDGDLYGAAFELEQFPESSEQGQRHDDLVAAFQSRCSPVLDEVEKALLAGQDPFPEEETPSREVANRNACAKRSGSDGLAGRVRRLFSWGDVPAARKVAQGCESLDPACGELDSELETFAERHARLDLLTGREVLDLLELEGLIAGQSGSKYYDEIRHRAGARFLKQSSHCKTKGDWACVAKNRKLLAELDHESLSANDLGEEARCHAKELYMQGYVMRASDPEEAVKMFHRVLEMTVPEDEYYQKALKLIGDDAL